jgi:hypothetical protein
LTSIQQILHIWLIDEYRPGVEKVSDHRTIGPPRKFFEFPENISLRKKKKIIVKIQKKNSNQ